MAGMSDGGQSAMISFSSMKQPPLIKQLKGILSEYPDGGQILKELIQNAEDADATVVKIEYDRRRLNDETSETTPRYSKFFKGPALCVYNDAVFNEEDWEGIRMIYSSVKEDDRLKVGRFGLGFKSVFHLTDYPCVLSGDKLLMIDPQQPSDKVNAMVRLSDIEQLGSIGLPAEVFWSALKGKCDLTRESIKNGYFEGTIFWFPLREIKSELSETLYDEQKVLDLYDDFSSDSSSVLVFLKNLEKIELSVAGNNNSSEMIASVEILDENGKARNSRRKFKKLLKEVNRDFKGDDIVHEVQMTIRTKTKKVSSDTDWVVVNYYVGNSASIEFRKLIEDEKLGYSPYVGVATPIAKPNEKVFEGHVFCFLPLPKEGSQLTGLPVHVNGYFALSQNRHHLKQETDEQLGKKIDDKTILWNQNLIKEAIPKAYCRLISFMIVNSNDASNTRGAVEMVYNCWPLTTNTLNRWKILESELYRKLKTLKVFYAGHTNAWIKISDSVFATFSSLPVECSYVSDAVKRCMSIVGLSHVEIPFDTFETVKYHFGKVIDIEPEMLAMHLRKHHAYKHLNSADKLDVLMYLLSEARNYPLVNGIELLPLASGEWRTFSSKDHTVFMCSDEVVDILKGMEDNLVQKELELGQSISSKLAQLCGTDYCQLKCLSVDEMMKLVDKSLNKIFGSRSSTKISIKWLQSLWEYIIKTKFISHFRNLQIVPKLIGGSWESTCTIELVRLSDNVLVKSTSKHEIVDGVARCFEKLGITVIDMLPDWMPRDKLKRFLFWPSRKGIMELLEFLYDNTNWFHKIDIFLQTCNMDDREALLSFLSGSVHLLNDKAREFIFYLPIFLSVTSIAGKQSYSSMHRTRHFILGSIDYPKDITLPFPCCLSDSETEQLMMSIRGIRVDLEELVLAKLRIMHKTDDTTKFMEYILKKIHLFQMNADIIEQASQIPFLRAGEKKRKPVELFDPSDLKLVHLLHGEFLLPETKNKLSLEKIRILRLLGLRKADDIDTHILFQVAKSLDTWSKVGSIDAEYLKKALAFKECLQCNQPLLLQSFQGSLSFKKCIEHFECILVDSNRNSNYPICLPWYQHNHILAKPAEVKEASMSLLVGSVQPTISCASETLNEAFGWKQKPEIHLVFEQLRRVKEFYSINVRPDVMSSIKALYNHLASRTSEVRTIWPEIHNKDLIWTGDCFIDAEKVTITKTRADLDLTPYVYSLPSEFEGYSNLFAIFGCHKNQNIHVLIDALRLIQTMHSDKQEAYIVQKDTHLACTIVDRIAQLVQNGVVIDREKVLMMVHDRDKSELRMCPLKDCVYDDDPEYVYEDTGNMHLVHEMISNDTAEALGIKSVTRKALTDAEGLGIEACGQQEPLTTRISSLLREGYTDGLSVPKELIQNADDAGATTIKFLYDERQNLNARQRVFSRGMKQYQGPALWVFNDAQFSEDDFQNITKLNGATKQKHVNKIGKFGLGFCSVYNLTDVPSFLSGNSLILFDPHETNLGNILHGKNAGLKYSLPNKTLVSRYADQFKPYNRIFNCQICDENFQSYQGTLFRLPLRTEQQAKESRICPKAYTDNEMKELLRMLITNAGNCLLFSQNIRCIEVYHLSENNKTAQDMTLIHRLHKTQYKLTEGNYLDLESSILSRMPQILYNNNVFRETHMYVIRQKLQPFARKLIHGLDEVRDQHVTPWIVSWAKGCDSSLRLCRKLESEGAVPLAAVAVPCRSKGFLNPVPMETDLPISFYNRGHIFCFLPLPIRTELKVHIHGCFAITSDRRQLITLSEDDKSTQRHSWNKCLMEDALVLAFVTLLQTIAENNDDENYIYHSLWPLNCGSFTKTFEESFYRVLISKQIALFKGHDTWVSFQHVCFLQPSIRKSEIGDIAVEFLSKFLPERSHVILIDMPEHVLKVIKDHNKTKQKSICSKEITATFLYKQFLSHIEDQFWASRKLERNKFIISALKSNDYDTTEMMQNINCIPTEPIQRLRKPSELVNPTSLISGLFVIEEEVLPLKTEEFRETNILTKLVALGMWDHVIPNALLENRCCSVETLARSCCMCACTRTQILVQYLSKRNIIDLLKADRKSLNVVSNACFLPVLPKPSHWAFSWKAESTSNNAKYFTTPECSKHTKNTKNSLILGQPNVMYSEDAKDYVGTVCLVLDENLMYGTQGITRGKHELFTLLGVKTASEIPVTLYVDQVLNLANEYQDKQIQLLELQRLHGKLFSTLERKTKRFNKIDISTMLKPMLGSPVVLVGDELVEARKVAFDIKHECKPFLYKLPTNELARNSDIYSLLGVRRKFDFETIIETMELVGCVAGRQADLSCVSNLLINLQDSLHSANKSYVEVRSFHDKILAPDSAGILWPTKDLVIENIHFQTNVSMKILHPSIAPQLGKELGVLVKQHKCFKSISFAVSFGQSEKLVTRIQGLLRAYPCDSSIMKELLQNADDAGATEICFVKDYRTHTCKHLFADTCAPLQGPSLCVYNNSYFTKNDIEGIRNLGRGSKQNDPTRTGQYGVGFNAVYHLTDTPSFVTLGPDTDEGGDFFIFDPLLKHVPDANVAEPGMRCKVADVMVNFPEHMLGFSLKSFINGGKGTVFRFPLRRSASDISSNILDEAKMDRILHYFKLDMMDAMLFLKNITRIKIIDITSGNLSEEYSVSLQCEDDVQIQRKYFNESVYLKTKDHSGSKTGLLDIAPIRTVYPLNLVDSDGLSKSWIIAQQFGMMPDNDKLDDIRVNFRSGDLGLLPTGGVAIPFEMSQSVSSKSMPFVGKAFCFLPLPIDTGLPVHVNGHFALDHESRRELRKDGYSGNWNTCLTEAVIVPAWVSGIEHVSKLISAKIEDAKRWFLVKQLCHNYYELFPDLEKTKVEYWKYVVRQFFQQVVNNRHNIFPTVDKKENGNNTFSASWTIVNPLGDTSFYGVYNSIHSNLSSNFFIGEMEKESNLISRLLKSFGMKLLEMPRNIKLTMEKAGINSLKSADPNIVVSFMKTFGDYFERSCDIGNVGVDIARTKYGTPQNLRSILMYIVRDIQDYENLEGLPIVLTADGVLRVCSGDKSVFVSLHAKLLPASLHLFLHEVLCKALSDHSKLCSSRGFKSLEFKDFCDLLPVSITPSIFGIGSTIVFEESRNTAGNIHVSREWLRLFYDFLCKNSKELVTESSANYKGEKTHKLKINIEKLSSNMDMLNDWSLLLCKRTTEHMLIPFRRKAFVFHLSHFQRQDALGKILDKLPIPRVDTDIFENHPEPDLKIAILKCVPNVENPHHLLKCLLYHKDAIKAIHALTVEDGAEVLAFFLRHIEILKLKDSHLYSDLRQLPFYVTQQGTMTDISVNGKVLIVPKDMPMDGIQKLANHCSITLLQENDSLTKLHQYLNLQMTDILQIYGEEILPNIHALPTKCLLTHITFLRDKLRGMYALTKAKQKNIYDALKRIAFITVNGALRTVNDLYDPENSVFERMLSDNNFIPREFLTDEWSPFLDKLGLIRTVDDDLLLDFARKIEIQGHNAINEEIQVKSEALLSCFTKNVWNEKTLSCIKSIRFIVPFCVDTRRSDIATPLNNRRYLICFKDSITSSKAELCWSSSSLIACDVVDLITTSVRCSLAILEEPLLESVVLHCQNVCQYLKMNVKDMDASIVKKQMSCFYEFFNRFDQNDLRKLLDDCPFIHLPEETDMVPTRQIVIDLNTDSEIKPYIYRAPMYYGQYHQLFGLVGCEQTCKCYHYANILGKIQSVCGDNVMSLPEKKTVQKALNGLLSLNIGNDDSLDEVDLIFLPNDRMCLKRSTEIIFSNNSWYEHRLRGLVELDLFADSRFLDVPTYNFEQIFSKWPERLRPIFLTNIVSEELRFLNNDNQEFRDSIQSQTIQTFLYSTELVTALCRLLKHQSSVRPTNAEYECPVFEAYITERLGGVRVVAMYALRTTLKYNGCNVNGSEKDKLYYIQPSADDLLLPCAFFFNDVGRERIDTGLLSQGLVNLIQRCTGNRLDSESFTLIASLVQCIDSPQKLHEILDQNHIRSHDSSHTIRREYFPGAGTYVEANFIPFLEQGMIPFRPYEYEEVAMELHDVPDDENSTLFIYVKIIGVVSKPEFQNQNLSGNMAILYLVNTRNGTPLERVPIFRLYRFVRRMINTGLELERVEAVSEQNMHFDDQCKQLKKELMEIWKLPESDRKRIVRRILLKWHPDKNRGNEKYCTEVFKYIKIIISRLENGEIIVDDVNEEMSRGPSSFSQSSEDFYDNVNRRAKSYASAYYANYEEYSRSQRSGPYSHSSRKNMAHGPSSFSRSSENVYDNDNRRAKSCTSASYDTGEEYSRFQRSGQYSHSRRREMSLGPSSFSRSSAYRRSQRSGQYSHSSRTVAKKQDIPEANRWFRQATHDFHTADSCFPAVEATKSFNWICNVCLHACENALLSAQFFCDADEVPTVRNLDITATQAATPEIAELARRLARRIGNHSRLTIPDSLSRPLIPSDMLSKEDAQYALNITRELLQLVSDYIS